MPNCAVLTCKNYNQNTKGRNIQYFSFPKDEDLTKKWIIACHRKATLNVKYATVCSIHFDHRSYTTPSLKNRRKLKPDSVPTLHLPKSSCSSQKSVLRLWERKRMQQNHVNVKEPLNSEENSNEANIDQDNSLPNINVNDCSSQKPVERSFGLEKKIKVEEYHEIVKDEFNSEENSTEANVDQDNLLPNTNINKMTPMEHPIVENRVYHFIVKLWTMVEDSSIDDTVCWSPGGVSFIIQNRVKFLYKILPMYYKYKHLSSFVRQLYLYGFHKIQSVCNGTMDPNSAVMQFFHPNFQRDKPEKLQDIKKKGNSNKIEENQSDLKHENLTEALTNIKELRSVQAKILSELSALKQENYDLWKDLAILRNKHSKQQQIFNKVIQFLITIAQPTSGTVEAGVERLPLILSENSSKSIKTKHSTNFKSSDGGPTDDIDAPPDQLRQEGLEESLIISSVSSENSTLPTQSLNTKDSIRNKSLNNAMPSYKSKLVPNNRIDLTESED